MDSFNERYGMDTPGRTDGALEPLGIDFTLDTIGVRQFPNLDSAGSWTPIRTSIAYGIPNWYASRWATPSVTLRDHIAASPLVFEMGFSKRFSIGIEVPYVSTHTSTFFNVNTKGIEGNLGFNPALASHRGRGTERDDVHAVHRCRES